MYFFLLVIGVLILSIGIKRNKKEKVTFTEFLRKEEIDLDAIDIVIGELRMEFASTILELQRDVMELNEKVDSFTKADSYDASTRNLDNIGKREALKTTTLAAEEAAVVDIENIKNEISPKVQSYDNENRNSSKISEISELLNKGFSIDEVCEKVQMGRGEILLIKELYLK